MSPTKSRTEILKPGYEKINGCPNIGPNIKKNVKPINIVKVKSLPSHYNKNKLKAWIVPIVMKFRWFGKFYLSLMLAFKVHPAIV